MQESLEKAKREKAQKTKKAQQSKKVAAASESPMKKTWDKQSHTSMPRYPRRNNRGPMKNT
eukprot:8982646-Ditylum_brightwellii.AAC.1